MLKPLRDFIVVSVPKADEKTASGLLYKPSTVEDKVVAGNVLSVGSGKLVDNGQTVPLEVKVNDQVLFSKPHAMEVKHNGETYYVLREEQVVCVIR